MPAVESERLDAIERALLTEMGMRYGKTLELARHKRSTQERHPGRQPAGPRLKGEQKSHAKC